MFAKLRVSMSGLLGMALPCALWCAPLLLSATASAQSKVGVINMQRAVLECAEIKKASADMEARYKPRQDQVVKLQTDLQTIQAKLQDPKTPQNLAADLQSDGTRKQRELQRLTDDLQADVERDRNDILGKAAKKMQEIVSKLAEEKSLDVVIDATNAVFFKPAMEVTQDAIAAYDKAYPAK